MNRRARWYRRDEDTVKCLLCPVGCSLKRGQTGACGVRRVEEDGSFISQNYGRVSALAVDPIEKKPLYHFYPGSEVVSVGTVGCNLACGFCQNWQLSTGEASTRALSPEDLAGIAADLRSSNPQIVGVAYTYSEPVVWYEYVVETARIVKDAGLLNILVTNGQIHPMPLRELLPLVDALNIDVKAFTQSFYTRYCSGTLEATLRTVQEAAAACHVEITTLLIPGLNDGDEEIRALVDWVHSVDPTIPLHFTRYHPSHRMRKPSATPIETLLRAREIAMGRLPFVYLGNTGLAEYAKTVCPQCGSSVVMRTGASVENRLCPSGLCPECGCRLGIRVLGGSGVG